MNPSPKTYLLNARRFIRGHLVLSIACVLTIITMFFVPPDQEYLTYFDVDTLICLFCILSVVGALRNTGAIERLARSLVARFSTPRTALCAIVVATGIISMFATNDMALIMMLPVSAAALTHARWFRLIPVTFVLQGLAANLCGMIMPFGNPQNLYLYSYYGLELLEFIDAMALPFLCSVVLIALCSFVVPFFGRNDHTAERSREIRRVREEASRSNTSKEQLPKILVYAALLLLTIASVFRIVPSWIALICVLAALALLDRKALAKADYPLLFTFAFFFMFAGNMARIPEVSTLFASMMEQNALVASALLSQVISNVPAAVLLSHFTQTWAPLLVGVNVGGAGTLIGSLASIIVLQHFSVVARMYAFSPKLRRTLSVKRFIALFSAFNFAFLGILLVVCGI